MNSLRRIREARGLAQWQLAAEAKVSQPTISRAEKGHDTMGSKLLRIAKALDTTVEEVLAEDDGTPE